MTGVVSQNYNFELKSSMYSCYWILLFWSVTSKLSQFCQQM